MPFAFLRRCSNTRACLLPLIVLAFLRRARPKSWGSWLGCIEHSDPFLFSHSPSPPSFWWACPMVGPVPRLVLSLTAAEVICLIDDDCNHGFVFVDVVGKSSLVRALSTALPEVNNYPFTTRGVTIGHIYEQEEVSEATDEAEEHLLKVSVAPSSPSTSPLAGRSRQKKGKSLHVLASYPPLLEALTVIPSQKPLRRTYHQSFPSTPSPWSNCITSDPRSAVDRSWCDAFK